MTCLRSRQEGTAVGAAFSQVLPSVGETAGPRPTEHMESRTQPRDCPSATLALGPGPLGTGSGGFT